MNQKTPPSPVKKGRELILDITTAAFEGKGLGRAGDYAVFVKNTAPGDRVRIRINRKRKNYAEGRLIEILEPSPLRITPKCRHAGVCGGCTWQHVPYEQELEFKSDHVADHFQRIGGFRDIQTEPVIRAPEPFYYRNKMEYTFGDRRWLTDDEIQSDKPIMDRDFALGLHVPGRYDRILNLEECHLQNPVSFRILEAVREYALANRILPYNSHKHEGFLRNLIIRNSVHTGDLMVNLVTNGDDNHVIQPMTTHLLGIFPEITTVINTINDTRSPSSEGRYQNVMHGPGYIREHIGSYHFRIDPDTFFQTNTIQAKALYDVVLQALGNSSSHASAGSSGRGMAPEPSEDRILYDLYCGVGTLSLYLSTMAKKVVGIEIHEGAVEKARENAAENRVKHACFEQGDMKDIFNDKLVEHYGRPDVIVTDPPRAGMHELVIDQIKKIAPEKIIYVSCNSATQARDTAMLAECYRVERVQPVDMFPRTYHIESVAVLSKKPI